jgi:hypothetical protein
LRGYRIVVAGYFNRHNMADSGEISEKHSVDQKTGFRDVAEPAQTAKTDKPAPGGVVEKALEAVEPGKGQTGKVISQDCDILTDYLPTNWGLTLTLPNNL